MTFRSSRQILNLTFAWAGALIALSFKLSRFTFQAQGTAACFGLLPSLAIACGLIMALRLVGRHPWIVRSSCFSLGLLSTRITVLLTT